MGRPHPPIASCDHAFLFAENTTFLFAENDTFVFAENDAFLFAGYKKDPIALKELINGWYGGASGEYDLGEVVVQIICKLGESEFINMALELKSEERNHLRQYIEAGLEYGNEYFFELKNKRNIKEQFPKLERVLQK